MITKNNMNDDYSAKPQGFSFIEKVHLALSLFKSSLLKSNKSNTSGDTLASFLNGRGNVHHRTGGMLTTDQHNDLVAEAKKARKVRQQ